MDRVTEKGSILVYILLAVALFAALSYAVSNMMRGNVEIGRENRAVLANDILGYARSVKETVQTLRITEQCSDTQISFERSPFDGSDTNYENAAAPSDFSCHVFHPQGGGLGSATPMAKVSAFDYVYTGDLAVSDVGSNAGAELSFIVRDIDAEICSEINEKLGLQVPQTDIATSANFYNTTFQGTYSLSSSVGDGIGTGDAMYNAQLSGCFYENNVTAGEHFFYQVLIPR